MCSLWWLTERYQEMLVVAYRVWPMDSGSQPPPQDGLGFPRRNDVRPHAMCGSGGPKNATTCYNLFENENDILKGILLRGSTADIGCEVVCVQQTLSKHFPAPEGTGIRLHVQHNSRFKKINSNSLASLLMIGQSCKSPGLCKADHNNVLQAFSLILLTFYLSRTYASQDRDLYKCWAKNRIASRALYFVKADHDQSYYTVSENS